MYKKYVTAIILFNCYCSSFNIDLQGDMKPAKKFSVNPELCKTILRNKGYYDAIEKTKRALTGTGGAWWERLSDQYERCSMGLKFSYFLLSDWKAWLCVGDILKMVKENMDLYETSIKKCNYLSSWNDINCGSPAKFETCVHMKMPTILEAMAKGEMDAKNACLKCREATNRDKCIQYGNLTQCSLWKNPAGLMYNLGVVSCFVCRVKTDDGRIPQFDDGPKMLMGSQHHEGGSHTATVVGISVSAVLGVVLSVSIGVLAYRYARQNTAQEPKGETEQTAMSDRREPSGRRALSVRYNPSVQYEPSVPRVSSMNPASGSSH